MSAQLIAFPNPAMSDSARVRELLAWLRPLLEKPLPADEFCAAYRVLRELQRRGVESELISMATLLAELRREQEAEKWLPADVIEFPRELKDEPLRTLAAEWWYFTNRAAYYRAIETNEPLPERVTRQQSNAFGDTQRKPGPIVAKRQRAQTAEAAEYVRALTEEYDRDASLLSYIAIMHATPLSPALQLIGRAIKARKASPTQSPRQGRGDSPEAA